MSPTHTLLLNKFNVVAYHVLVVTKQFEHQTDPLNLQDLEATWQTVQVTYCVLLTLHSMPKHTRLLLFAWSVVVYSCRQYLKVPLPTSIAVPSLVLVNHTSIYR